MQLIGQAAIAGGPMAGVEIAQYHDDEGHNMVLVVSRTVEVDGEHQRQYLIAPDTWVQPVGGEPWANAMVRIPCPIWDLISAHNHANLLRELSSDFRLLADMLLGGDIVGGASDY